MSYERERKVRKRRRRRSSGTWKKKVKAVLAMLAGLSLLTGLIMIALGPRAGLERARSVGAGYLLAAAGFLAGYGLLEGTELVRRWLRRRNEESLESSRSASTGGFALLFVLMLLALVTTVSLQAQVYARVALRHAQVGLDHARLRLAAGDALWHAADAAVRGRLSNAAGSARRTESEDPSGIRTVVELTPAAPAAVPTYLHNPKAGPPTSVFDLRATARLGEAAEEVRSLIAVAPGGTVRVLAWIERP